jgi:chromosome segregation ATPase
MSNVPPRHPGHANSPAASKVVSIGAGALSDNGTNAAAMEIEIEQLIGSSHEAENTIALTRGALTRARDRIRQVTAAIDQLRQQLDRSTQATDEARHRITALEVELKSLESYKTDAQARIAAYAQREERFKSTILAHRAREQDLSQKIASLQESVAKTRDEVNLYKSSWTRVLQTEREAQAFVAQRDALEERLRKVAARSEELIAEARDRSKTEREMREAFEERLAAAQQETARARDELQKSTGDTEDLVRRVMTSQGEAEARERAAAELARRVEKQKDEEIAAARRALAELTRTKDAEIEAARRSIGEVTRGKDDEVAAAQLEAEEIARAKDAEIAAARREVAEAARRNNEDLKQASREIARCKEDLARTQADLVRLQETLTQNSLELAQAKSDSKHSVAESRRAQAETQRLEGEARRFEAELIESRKRFEAEKERLAAELAETRKKLEEESARLALPIIQIDDDHVSTLTEKFQAAHSDREELQAERDRLRSQLETAVREMQEARATAQIYQDKSERLKRTYPLRDLLAHKEAEIARATRELRSIDDGSPAREKAEDIVSTLRDQRDQLRAILKDSEI